MKKIIALAVAVAFAGPAFAEDAKKPANPAAGNTPAVTTPAAKPADTAVKPQPVATTQKQGEVKKDDVKKVDVKKDEKKADVKPSTPAAGAQPATTGQKTSEKPAPARKTPIFAIHGAVAIPVSISPPTSRPT